ncbi:hypothetical protein ACLB2K_014288 [Fragaria x ananassa]
MDRAVGFTLIPPFDPYADSLKFLLLATYLIPYVGENGYVGTIPYLIEKENLADWLHHCWRLRRDKMQSYVHFCIKEPMTYNLTVAHFTNRISMLRNELGMCGIKDEGIIVPEELGAENRTSSNIISADPNSLAYARTPPEILRIVYSSGNESLPGGFYPEGANGKIARHFLKIKY